MGFMNIGVAVGIWTATSWGLYLAPGGNLVYGTIVSLFFCMFGIAFVWGMLGGSMPRSGGDYIPNSRIIHPAVGVAVSMANAGFIMTFWNALLAPWIADPGLKILGGLMGWNMAWCSEPWGLLLVGSIVNLWGFLIVSLGLKHYLLWQRSIMFAALFCLIVTGAVMTFHSHSDFVSSYDVAAAKYGSYNYTDTIAQANIGMAVETGTATTTQWDLASTFMLFPSISWIMAYGYVITFICGEVKRPQRNILLGQILAMLIPSMIALWFFWGLHRLMGGEFMQAAAYFDNGSESVVNGFALPSGANYISLLSVLSLDNKVILFLMGLTFILYDLLYMPLSYIAWTRATLAWGMDRLGPMWFSEVSVKYATNIKPNFIMLASSQIGILIYALRPEYIYGLGITALEAMSVWGVTALSATIFPYVKRSRAIWEASPYRWRIGPIFLITVAGIVNLVYIGILLYELETTEGIAWIHNYATWIFLGVWLFSLAWYFIWKRYWMMKGIDIGLAWKQLPPA